MAACAGCSRFHAAFEVEAQGRAQGQRIAGALQWGGGGAAYSSGKGDDAKDLDGGARARSKSVV